MPSYDLQRWLDKSLSQNARASLFAEAENILSGDNFQKLTLLTHKYQNDIYDEKHTDMDFQYVFTGIQSLNIYNNNVLCFPQFVTLLRFPSGYEKNCAGLIDTGLEYYKDNLSILDNTVLYIDHMFQPAIANQFRDHFEKLRTDIVNLYKFFCTMFDIH